jgi:hypothetical protein
VKINLPVTGRNVDVALDEGRQSQRNSEDVAGLAGDLMSSGRGGRSAIEIVRAGVFASKLAPTGFSVVHKIRARHNLCGSELAREEARIGA